MKSFRDRETRMLGAGVGVLLATVAGVAAMTPLVHNNPALFQSGHGIERWIENVPFGSDVEKALYRVMQLPGGDVLFRRSPRETVPALTGLQQSQRSAALYSLRALEEEQALDFSAAERDWKTWADQAEDRITAHLDLADFYERRLQPQQELAALAYVGNSAPTASERWTAVASQRSWKAFDRSISVIDEFALPRADSAHVYADWIKRYPQEPSLYARQLQFLLAGKDFVAASSLISQYHSAFPEDRVFPMKAEADLAVSRGQTRDGLAVYDARFEALWPPELVKSYFALVIASHNQRAFGDATLARLAANPDDLKDAARLFYLYQQQGQMDSAKAVLTKYRESKEARGASWSGEELGTWEKLFEAIQDFPEAARYAYALAADRSSPASERTGVIALARILLTAPEQPLRVGAGNLALYRNIATMDRGPGYLNGILSLLLNSQGPGNEYAAEDQLAVPYFHRARAAELLEQIDRRFPDAPERPQLHTSLMEAYLVYGDNQAVIREGTAILERFPLFEDRVRVALQLADAYERTRQPDKEFALYQGLLKELAAEADGVPLGAPGGTYSKPVTNDRTAPAPTGPASPAARVSPTEDISGSAGATADEAPRQASAARSTTYAQVLDRYLGRLVSLDRLPDALAVLRGELDRNPQDPGLYERLADFLQQNSLNEREEEVFQRAIQQFQETGWYAKLARFYLRQKRNADYTALMQRVAAIFSGTDLEEFLQQAPTPNRALSFEVDRYANQRFPHDLRFVERLIAEYTAAGNGAALEKLLWEHWPESPDIRERLFALLVRTGRLDAELATLRQQAPEIEKADWNGLAARNPAAERFWLEACLWQSHFEQGVDAADALAAAYPADATLGEQASSLYRSLAYFHTEDTDKAITIQKRLLEANPGNLDTLARIGDIYADRERFADASPYWARMAEVRPGDANGYLQSSTVYWDYFDFVSAQSQLDKARIQLHQPTLFGYQLGAIAESRGDSSAAVRAYSASAAADPPSAESRERLLALARRPALRAQVEGGTANLLREPAPSPNAIELRADILEAQHRKDDLNHELSQAIAQTGSFDVLDAITTAARGHSLPDVEEAALRRQIALTTDPVRTLQLRYQLVDFLQQQQNASGAAQEIDAIYREHNKILGVVRSTVDYDWAHDRKPQAVAVLIDSAQIAYPDLKSRFRLEAARKLTDLGDYARSRAMLTSLLREKPLDADYESAMADNLAQTNDASGLASFFHAQLDLVRSAQLNHEEKQQRIGQLRRGIIRASTQLGNFNDAVDQYIELINAFPEDGALAQEAALYSIAHGARGRLFGFYQKTISDSPKDPRWSIALARMAAAAEDDALAIDSYGKALRLRPERQDLYIAQAALDERLHRFDEAIVLYSKLYTLSYRDPRWMEKVAELSAREGHNADCVKALETAWTEGRPAKASNYFAVAQRLEPWGMLDEARQFAEKGVEAAGADLLVSEQSGAATYARILARKRLASAAFTRLSAARDQAPRTTMATIAQQVMKQGPGAVTDDEWQKQRAEQRRTQASAGFAQALQSMAAAVAEFYTPEEKSTFAALFRQNALSASSEELASVYLPAVRAAGLTELTVELEWTAARRSDREGDLELASWLQLQKRRVQMEPAAALLEKSAPGLKPEHRVLAWRETVNAYRDAGDASGELRAMEHLYASQQMEGEDLNRYYGLLLSQRPDALIRLAASQDSAAYYLVREGNFEQALAGVSARADGRPPVWRSAYTGLAGLYLGQYRADIGNSFSTALDADATIGDRIAHPSDRTQHIAGDVWFYYGSRYAEFLDGAKDPRYEGFLDSELERTPGSSGAYLRLADYSSGMDRANAAFVDYQHSLDLNRDQPAVLGSVAELEWKEGRRSDASAAWNEAVKQLANEMDARHVPETFWSDFQRVLGSIVEHNQYDSVSQAVDAMLRTYVARNGNYRAEPLLEAGYRANHDSVEWLLSITSNSTNQRAILSSILPNPWNSQGGWIEVAQLDRIYRRLLDLAQRDAQGAQPELDQSVDAARRNYVEALIDEKKYAEARVELAKVPPANRNSAAWLPSILKLAQADGTVDQLIASWQSHDDMAPVGNDLLSASTHLNARSKRQVQRFVYQRALDHRDLSAANFLGLASIELDENKIDAAVALLKRLTVVSDAMYADADAAARLLEDHHRPAEALQFLRPLADSSPWEAGYRVRMANAMLALDARQAEPIALLTAIVADPRAIYTVRESAANALKGRGAKIQGSDELTLLGQSSCPTPESVSKPFYVLSRLTAAACSTSPKTRERLLHDALSTSPDNAQVRLQYIFAAFAANFESRALVAAEPYFQNGSYDPDNNRDSPAEANSADSSERTGDEGDSSSLPRVSDAQNLATLSSGQAARLAELAAAAYQRRGDFANASRVAGMGLAVVKTPETRKLLEARKKQLDTEIARGQANDARAPSIRAELDQPAIVRPRLRTGDPIPLSTKPALPEESR